MAESSGDRMAVCPFVSPKYEGRREVFPLQFYCRLPSGRVRIPTRDELATFCLAGHHQDCPGYRRARAWAAGEPAETNPAATGPAGRSPEPPGR